MIDFSLSPVLVRAARVLLGWQQSDLAKASGLSLSAVKAYEHQSGVSRERTALALRFALENHGIEFLPSGGLRRVEDVATISRFSGPDFIRRWNDDIYMSVRNSNDEILSSFANEGLWHQAAVRQANKEYHAWCEQKGFKLRHKILIPEGQKDFSFPKQVYRLLPRDMLGKIHYSLYADRLAFVLWKKRQVIVLRNTAIVETFRGQFTYLWRLGKAV